MISKSSTFINCLTSDMPVQQLLLLLLLPGIRKYSRSNLALKIRHPNNHSRHDSSNHLATDLDNNLEQKMACSFDSFPKRHLYIVLSLCTASRTQMTDRK
jgi:hypothetical protein